MTVRQPLVVLAVALLGVAWMQAPAPGFQLTDITESSGLRFSHYTGASGRKYLPETLGSGAAFVDIDGDGAQDVIFANGTDWPGSPGQSRAT